MSRTVLLLEADDLAQETIQGILKKAHFEVIPAKDFREAFLKIKTFGRELSLAILDFELATDDADILDRLRRLDFDQPLPVLLMGQVQLGPDEISQLSKDSGYAGYICKAMPAEEILERICKVALPEDERRLSPRVYFQSRAHCLFGDRNFLGEVYTLSLSGAFIKMNQPIVPQVGQLGSCSFNGSIEGKQLVKIEVEVVYSRAFDPKVMSIHPAGIAVRFQNLSVDLENCLKKIIEHQARQGQVYAPAEDL